MMMTLIINSEITIIKFEQIPINDKFINAYIFYLKNYYI